MSCDCGCGEEKFERYLVTYIDFDEEPEIDNVYTVKAWVGNAQSEGYAESRIWEVSQNHEIISVRRI